MVYTDLLFFFGLLPISVIVSFFDRSTEYKNLILVITSLLFYSWGKPFAVCLMFLSSIVDWALGIWVGKEVEKGKDGIIPLFIDGIMNGAILIFVTDKFLFISDDVFEFGKIIIPLSIGFYCLKGFSYVYDVYKKRVKAEKNVFCIFTYMTAYFLIPVGAEFNTNKILPQIRKREFTLKGFDSGLTALVCGLSKAIVLSPALRKIGQAGFESKNLSFVGCFAGSLAMIGFSYFLFTGFCDMSYGLGRIYGFEIDRNYRNITANGVYNGFIKNINVALSNLLSNLNSKSNIALKCIGAVLLCAVGGFWYSRDKMLVFAGIAVGIMAVLELTILKGFFKKAPAIIRWIVTFFGTVFVCTMAFSKDIDSFIQHFKGLFNVGTAGFIDGDIKSLLLGNIFIVLISVIFIYTPLKNKVKVKVCEYSLKSIEKYGRISVVKTVLTAILFVICIVIMVSANIKL